jgi:hypothetical protein
MKQLLLPILLSMTFTSVEAQQNNKKSRFAFVAIAYDARDEMYDIRIDSGQAPIKRTAPMMTDSFGQVIKFVSPASALNYVESAGWKLVEVIPNTEGSFSLGTSLAYLFKKDY